MTGLQLKMRLIAINRRISKLSGVSRAIRDFSTVKGLLRIFMVPQILSESIDCFLDPDDYGAWEMLPKDEWKRSEALVPIARWLLPRVDEDKSIKRVQVDESQVRVLKIYEDAGLAFNFRTDGYNSSRDTDVKINKNVFNAWFKRSFSEKDNGLIRMVEMSKSSGGDDGDVSIANWSIEMEPTKTREIVTGAWAPPVSKVQSAMEGGRTVLLFGPSGTGKTETAIQSAEGRRVLVLPGHSFSRRALSGRGAAELCLLFGVSVLVIDDLPQSVSVSLLEEFEPLGQQGVSVVITVMTDEEEPLKLPGLRPGRVDEMLEFHLPELEDQTMLLRYFAPGVDWGALLSEAPPQGLGPAYLKELASRVVRGQPYLEALRSLERHRSVAT